jgi:hypothetical protein
VQKAIGLTKKYAPRGAGSEEGTNKVKGGKQDAADGRKNAVGGSYDAGGGSRNAAGGSYFAE